MFRVLSDEEAQGVTRWQAPVWNGKFPLAKTHQVATPVRLDSSILRGKSVSANEVLREVARRAEQNATAKGLSGHVGRQSDTRSGTHGDRSAGGVAGQDRQTAPLPFDLPTADSLQTSYDEGYGCGYAEGFSALHEESVRQLQAAIEVLTHSAVNALEAAREKQIEQEVMSLSLDIARLLLGRAVTVDPQALASLVQAGLAQLPVATGPTLVKVHLNPLQAQMLRESQLPGDTVEFLDDPSLLETQCRVETESSTVNCGVENWLEQMADRLGIAPQAVTQD